MSRVGFDQTRDQKIADEFRATNMACSFCGGITDTRTLSAYGARCDECFAVYLNAGRPTPKAMTRAEKVERLQQLKRLLGSMGSPGREWAKRLKVREEAGEHLTPFQREAWRSAMRANATLDAVRDGQSVDSEDIDAALRVTGDLPAPIPDEATRMRLRFSADPRFGQWAAGAAQPEPPVDDVPVFDENGNEVSQ